LTGSLTRYDVAVVGAGPAGSCAAVRLAQAGVKTLLLEKASFPRDKTCGGGVVGRCVQRLPIVLGRITQRECRRVVIAFEDLDLSVECVREEPIISMVMRDQFDMALALCAQNAGADLFQQRPVDRIEPDPSGVTLRSGRDAFRADLIIAADGATGPTARALGWTRRRKAVPAIEAEVSVRADLLDRCVDAARFDFRFVPHGYAWIFPKRDHLSVGVLSTQPPRQPLQQYLAAYLRALGIDAPRRIVRHGYVIPLSPVDPPFGRGRALAVGDAVGFADPVTAEGISFAVLTGQLAAGAIIHRREGGPSIRRAYHAALKERVLPELRVARLYANVLYGRRGVTDGILRQHAEPTDEVLVDVFSGAATYSGALATPRLLRQLLAVRSAAAA
jgi:geranylgeranyl reductase family protein